jgi:hypothetical protein
MDGIHFYMLLVISETIKVIKNTNKKWSKYKYTKYLDIPLIISSNFKIEKK